MGLPRDRARVLIVDDDAQETARLRAALAPRFTCHTASTKDVAGGALSGDPFDVIVSGNSRGASGLHVLDVAQRQSPATPVIVLADDAAIPMVMLAGKHGAFDYVLRSINTTALSDAVDRAWHHEASVDVIVELPPEVGAPIIIGGAKALVAALAAVERAAYAAAPVLLVGETGTGKELLAARLHTHGPRRHRPYVVVNAGAIPSALLDSELFGHVAGAFTGATRARRGLIAEADGGTLFLDEIADLPMESQGRLLRVVELGMIRAVGADHERKVDVRFVAATHQDLAAAVRAGRFRDDLYFRLHVLAIKLPPLRDRREDIPALVDYFFDRARLRAPRSPVQTLTEGARLLLSRAPWPGNVRELQAFIERLVVLGEVASIDEGDLGTLGVDSVIVDPVPPSGEEPLSLHEMTMRHVDSVLVHTHGDKARAASILGVDVSTLYRWRRRWPNN